MIPLVYMELGRFLRVLARYPLGLIGSVLGAVMVFAPFFGARCLAGPALLGERLETLLALGRPGLPPAPYPLGFGPAPPFRAGRGAGIGSPPRGQRPPSLPGAGHGSLPTGHLEGAKAGHAGHPLRVGSGKNPTATRRGFRRDWEPRKARCRVEGGSSRRLF